MSWIFHLSLPPLPAISSHSMLQQKKITIKLICTVFHCLWEFMKWDWRIGPQKLFFKNLIWYLRIVNLNKTASIPVLLPSFLFATSHSGWSLKVGRTESGRDHAQLWDINAWGLESHFHTGEKDLISTSGYFQKTLTERRLETGQFCISIICPE